MSNTVKLPTCPKCGLPIPVEAPQGLCPKCVLLGAATATELGVPATATSEIPSIERIAVAFPQLEILELIGRGGMGFVFKARQPHLDRFVALKLLPDKLAKDPQFAERFNREGRVLAKLNHPNIVSVYDFGQAGGFYYLSMEYVDGVNLRQAMRAGRFSPAEALSVVPKVCEALQYAHEQGILHRDIKPENILLDAKGRVKIADFGIAKLVGEDQPNITLTNTGAALGTPHYMAPEQLEKPATVDHRADIYSLGVVFYEMLTGELPIGRFAAPSSKTPVNSTVDDVVFRTLEKDRERRFQSAGEMQTQVEHLTATGLRGESLETTPPGSNNTEIQAVIPLVENPARALLAAGILSWAGSTAAIVWMSFGGAGQQCLNTRPELVLVITPLFALSSVIIAGALKMRKLEAHPLAVAASVLAMLTSLGSIVGLPAGLWAFRTLRRANVRAAFAQQRQSARPPLPPGPLPVSRTAFLGAASTILSLPFPLVAIIMMLSHKGGMGIGGLWITIITACGFGVAGTILGCLGVSSIMESRGRLRGLGMGWFAAATWPLLVVVGIPLSIPWFSLAERSGRNELQPAAANVKVETAPMIQFTFTAVELLDERGARWLSMDYVEQVRGDCQPTFRYDAHVPGFNAVTFKRSFMSDAKAGFQPVMHQRIMWKLPESLPQADALALRDLVAKEWVGKSAAIEPGDERVLFKTLVPDGGTLASAVGVISKQDTAGTGEQEGKAAARPESRSSTLEFRLIADDADSAQPVDVLPERQRDGNEIKHRVLRTIMLDGSAVAHATFETEPAGTVAISVDLSPEGARQFGAVTAANTGRRLAIVSHGRILSTPVIRSAITGGQVKISGAFSADEASRLVAALNRLDEEATSTNQADTEEWTPKLAPGEQPKPFDILQEAARLVQEGQYEQALQRHLWYHQHALEFQSSQAGVRLSFALSQWMELARRYPKAKHALVEIRDRGARRFSDGGGSFSNFVETTFLNKSLGEDHATVTLFKSIQEQNPRLARQCYQLVADLLVETGEYALSASFIPDVQKRFDQIYAKREKMWKEARKPNSVPDLLRQEGDRVFIKEARTFIEILVGTGRKSEADDVRDQAVAVLDVPELRSAVTDAEKRVAKHSIAPKP